MHVQSRLNLLQCECNATTIDGAAPNECRHEHQLIAPSVSDLKLQYRLNERCYISVITVGELRRGIEMIRHRGDIKQANALREWYAMIVSDYGNQILAIDVDVVSIWADLRVPHYENALDKLIAATALLHSLQVVTRNIKNFEKTGVKAINPFN